MIVGLEEMKNYLRIDYDDDDEFLLYALDFSESLCADIARMSVGELEKTGVAGIAVMYAVAYLYEHREDADHHALTISLRSLLFSIRKEEF